MPNWKKVIVSGSDASLNSLFVLTSVTGSSFLGSFTGSLFGTSSWAQNAVSSSYALNATSASFAPTATNVFLQGGNSFGTQALLGTNDIQNLAFETSGSIRMTISSSGNVGIGTTSPSAKLDVSGSANIYDRLNVGTEIDWPAGVSNAIATFKQASSAGGVIIQETGNASFDRILKLNSDGNEQSIESTYRDTGPYGNLLFKTGGSTRMYISGSGNVGIGTTTPNAKLNVSGSAIITGSLNVTQGITGSLFGTASWANNATTASYILNATSASYAATASNVLGGATNYIPLWNSNTTLSSSVMYQSSSNVGIGTTSPAAAGGTALAIYGGASQARLALKNSATGDGSDDGLQIGVGTDGGAFLEQRENNYMILSTNATERMRIFSGGNVFIGSSPSDAGFKLDVNGTIRGTSSITGTQFLASNTNGLSLSDNAIGGFLSYGYNSGRTNAAGHNFYNGISTELMRITSGGAVGIGTTSPAYKLDVSGSARVTSSLFLPGLTTTSQTNVVTVDTATGQLYYTASSAFGGGGGGAAFPYTGSAQITGSLGVTGSISVSGSLSVKDSITIGGSQIYYNSTASSTSPSTTTVFNNNTGSFTSAFYNYTLASGSNARSGQISAVWAGNSIQYNDYSTVDIGTTLAVTASVAIVTGQVQLNVTVPASSAGWNIKATATYL